MECWLTSIFLICFLKLEPYLVPYFPTIPTFFVRLACNTAPVQQNLPAATAGRTQDLVTTQGYFECKGCARTMVSVWKGCCLATQVASSGPANLLSGTRRPFAWSNTSRTALVMVTKGHCKSIQLQTFADSNSSCQAFCWEKQQLIRMVAQC